MTALLPLFLGAPILAAGLCVIAPWRAVHRILAYGIPATAFLGALALLHVHRTGETAIAVSVGSYLPGVAIPFASDSFTALMIGMCSLVGLLAVWFADLSGELRRNRFFAALTLLLFGGVFGALLTADLFNLFVMVEVMLMPSYALLALTGTLRRIAAGRLFVVINLLTSTLLVAAVGLVYAVSGAVNLAALAGAARSDGRLAFALGLVIVALCIKAGAVPVHGWLPRTYPATSPGVMALFAGLHTKVALYAVIRIWAVAFDLDPAWGWLLFTVALVTTLLGAFASAAAPTARAVLAWQMVSGVGVILASLAVGTTLQPGESGPQLATKVVGAALTGAIVYMIHHMLTIGGLISGYGALELRYGTDALYGTAEASRGDAVLRGLWWRERPTAIVLLILIAALIGLPFTSGMIGKFEVIRAATAADGWTGKLTVFTVLSASLLGLIAMVRLWGRTMWDSPDGARAPEPGQPPRKLRASSRQAHQPSRMVTAPAVVFAVCSIALFCCYSPLLREVNRAVIGLVDTRGYVMAVLGPEAVDGHYMLPPLDDAAFRPLAGDDAREALHMSRGR